MGWSAETNFKDVRKGMLLTILFSPHVPGYPPPSLAAEDDLAIVFAQNTRAKGVIVEASEDRIVIEMPNKSRWVATPCTEREAAFAGVESSSIPSTKWTIRSKV